MEPSNKKDNPGNVPENPTNGNKENSENSEYQFMREHIKDCKDGKPCLWKRILMVVILAVIFGIVAGLVFYLTKTVADNRIQEEEPEVVIPQDEISIEEEPEPEPDTVYITETIEVADYQSLQYQVFAVGKKASNAMAVVTGVSNDVDWFNDEYQSQDAGSGVVFMKNERELLLLTYHSAIKGAETITVTFNNGVSAEATLESYETNSGLAVISVATENLDESTLNYIQPLELGNSQSVTVGAMVVAIGSPNGENGSIMTGNVVNKSAVHSFWDVNYSVLSTDIMGASNAEGIILDMDGMIVGVIDSVLADNQQTYTQIKALPISDLKGMIEKLSNQRQLATLGVKISAVTEAIAQEHGLPTGVYVKTLQMDSPAMQAGIQEGDVIVSLDGKEITDEISFEDAIAQCRPEDTVDLVVKRLAADGSYQEVECQAVLAALQ